MTTSSSEAPAPITATTAEQSYPTRCGGSGASNHGTSRQNTINYFIFDCISTKGWINCPIRGACKADNSSGALSVSCEGTRLCERNHLCPRTLLAAFLPVATRLLLCPRGVSVAVPCSGDVFRRSAWKTAGCWRRWFLISIISPQRAHGYTLTKMVSGFRTVSVTVGWVPETMTGPTFQGRWCICKMPIRRRL